MYMCTRNHGVHVTKNNLKCVAHFVSLIYIIVYIFKQKCYIHNSLSACISIYVCMYLLTIQIYISIDIFLVYENILHNFWALSHLTIFNTPLPPLPLLKGAIFIWKMLNRLKWMKNQLYDFYFSSWVDFVLQIHWIFSRGLLTIIIDQKCSIVFVPENAQCSETDAEPNFRFFPFLVVEI